MLFKLSYLNSNLALTLGYLNPALNNLVLICVFSWWTARYNTTLTDDHFSTCKPTAESLHVHSIPFEMEIAAVG